MARASAPGVAGPPRSFGPSSPRRGATPAPIPGRRGRRLRASRSPGSKKKGVETVVSVSAPDLEVTWAFRCHSVRVGRDMDHLSSRSPGENGRALRRGTPTFEFERRARGAPRFDPVDRVRDGVVQKGRARVDRVGDGAREGLGFGARRLFDREERSVFREVGLGAARGSAVRCAAEDLGTKGVEERPAQLDSSRRSGLALSRQAVLHLTSRSSSTSIVSARVRTGRRRSSSEVSASRWT